jgi:ATP-dependent Clp protease ATP-binding subunit ClpB
MQLEIEIEAIKRENDETKLERFRFGFSELKEERNEILPNGNQKKMFDNIQKVKARN